MQLDPDAQAILDMVKAAGRPPFHTISPAEARVLYAAGRTVLQPEPQDVAEVRDLTAPGPHGDVPLRLYRGIGTKSGDALPCLVYFHGGGWVLGDLDSHDTVCRRLANQTDGCVVSVDYRMAPEYVFPAAVDDSAAAVRFVAAQAGALGIDPSRIAVGGDSAGGNLAAVMALMARDGNLPPLCFQLLIYPATDLAGRSDAYRRITDGYPLTAPTMFWFRDLYLRGEADWYDWRASPLRAASLAGTAPAMVITCSHDPLVDEGIAYAKRLEQDGVRVMHTNFSDQIHGFLTMGKFIKASGIAHDLSSAALRAAWGKA
jgi:acetyl esterase